MAQICTFMRAAFDKKNYGGVLFFGEICHYKRSGGGRWAVAVKKE